MQRLLLVLFGLLMLADKSWSQSQEGQVNVEQEILDELTADIFVELANKAIEELDLVERDSDEWHIHIDTILTALYNASELGSEDAHAQLGVFFLFGNIIEQNSTLAQTYLQRAADTGSPVALVMLGFMYAQGWGVTKNVAKALVYYSLAAREPSSQANLILGYRYLTGDGVPISCETALTHYREAADQAALWIKDGNFDIDERHELTDDGDTFESAELIKENVRFHELAAEYGDPTANAFIGNLYLLGLFGYPQDYQLAREYAERAVQGGNAEAYGQLGTIYHEGLGVPASNKTAEYYFEKGVDLKDPHSINSLAKMKVASGQATAGFLLFKMAADMGDVDGQFNLGACYLQGVGTKQNFREALRYFSVSAANYHRIANYFLGLIYDHGWGTIRSCEIAVKYYKLAAEQGPSVSLANAFEAFQRGDYRPSFMLYAFQAEMGVTVAQHNAAHVLDLAARELTDEDEKVEMHLRAIDFWTHAGLQGDAYAFIMIGDQLYYNGQTPQSFWEALQAASETPAHLQIKAAEMYAIAALDHRSPRALYNLGFMHQYGIGVQQDFVLAETYYTDAMERHVDAWIPATLSLWFLRIQKFTHSLTFLSRHTNKDDDNDDDVSFLLDLLLVACVVLAIALLVHRMRLFVNQ